MKQDMQFLVDFKNQCTQLINEQTNANDQKSRRINILTTQLEHKQRQFDSLHAQSQRWQEMADQSKKKIMTLEQQLKTMQKCTVRDLKDQLQKRL